MGPSGAITGDFYLRGLAASNFGYRTSVSWSIINCTMELSILSMGCCSEKLPQLVQRNYDRIIDLLLTIIKLLE